ncbi:oligosaccharide flippase family protein [Mesorhizobium sp. M1005]|uniref:lipopolysaccharide biosynthesis protein n=1 Tax=unclassified Mesorhizobium TaxID=325217 RepID=UPI0033370AE2
MAKLALGSILGRAISLVTVPILARIYTPADYGMLSVYTSLVLILQPIVTLRYLVGIPLPKRDEMALNLFALSGLLLMFFTPVLAVLLGLFGPQLLSLLSVAQLAPWWWLVVIGVVATSLAELLNLWATRRRAYRLIATNSVIIITCGESIKIAMGLLGITTFGLLFGQMIGQSGGIFGFSRAFAKDFRRIPQVVTMRRLRYVAGYYWTYPAFRLPSQFLLAFALQAPLLYTAGLYGVDVSGQLGMALLTLALPVNLIGGAMGKAYYAEIARLGRSRPAEILAVTKKVQQRLFLIGIVPTMVLMFFGPKLFALAFGPKWLEAGHFAAVLSTYTLLQFTSAPLMQLLNIFNRQGVFLIISVGRVALILSLFWVVSHLKISVDNYVRAYGAIMTVFYTIITVYVFLLAGRAKRAR